jgi:hypothetical protein
VILLDTTVLNNFAHIERPDLLQLVYADAATTTQGMLDEKVSSLAFAQSIRFRV